ncbi:Uncharacterized protein BP5553_05912 [Venustampulla echinocandica]|uniref:Uncharacterized protein n=1 Tax=Venustampulla echinocandica TaxID=2656787 RepID=A0A370TM07_9HELO|nr:Uncharacterized protein BP5553_05912 [Venustampulla echinocandica]RDL36560.1 Uncharacterized protein BP5553_05912 [Venustampulla echinocandica]
MENDWLDGNWASDYGTPEFLTSNRPRAGTAAEQASPVAQPASQAAERVDEPRGDHVLPLLRLSSWNVDKQYDKNNPVYIHYDFRWKISQRENIRARHVCSDTDPDLVLAPGDFWKVDFQARLESLLQDEDKFPGDTYTCEETIIEISVERSRQRSLSKRFKKLEINWQIVDEHLEGLGDLFSKGRKITFSIEFVYKEITSNSTTPKGKKKKKSATEAQKLQRAADASLWSRLYELHRYRAKHYKQGPHCLLDERGNHRKLLPAQLEEIVCHIRANMKERETEEDVEVDIEIPPHILKHILDNSCKRKAEDVSADCRHCKVHTSATLPSEDLGDVEGDRQAKLEEYCNWGLTQVESDRWRNALQIANQVAIDQFLELNTILQHPKVVAELIVKNKVLLSITLQFMSNIKKFLQEEKEI